MADESGRPARALRSQLLNAIHHACSARDLSRACFQLAWVLDWRFMADDGLIYNEQADIGAEMGWNERHARRVLKELEHAGFLLPTRRGSKSNTYRFNYQKATQAAFNGAAHRTTLSGPQPNDAGSYVSIGAPDWTGLSGQGGQECPVRPDICCPDYIESETLSESSIRDSKKRENPHEDTRQRFAQFGLTDSELQLGAGLDVWNAMRDRIGADRLHVLRDSHRKRLLLFLRRHGLDAWRAVVGEIERDPLRNGQHEGSAGPTRLGKALLRAQGLLELAIADGTFTPPPPPTDDEAMLT